MITNESDTDTNLANTQLNQQNNSLENLCDNSSAINNKSESISKAMNISGIDQIKVKLNDKKRKSYDSIEHAIVTNDGSQKNLVRLIGLKSLFAKQLPKMPKEYIVRLVFDRRHKSLALLSNDPSHEGSDEEIIGGICYRVYEDMRFAEIAFCAVSASQQVKGYGTKLMNFLKMHAVNDGVEYFITYADNYAIGYFKKQGFTKTITMPKGRFHGLIKDYDGGTMMECYVHPSIDYTRVSEMLTSQRKFILNRIRTVSKSDKKTYPPLSLRNSPSRRALPGRINESVARTMAIPGVSEAGWTVADLLASTNAAKDSDMQKNHLKSELLSIMCVSRSDLLVYFVIALNSYFISHVMSNYVSCVL